MVLLESICALLTCIFYPLFMSLLLHCLVLFCSLCSILFGFITFSVSLYTLYSLGFFLLSLSLSQWPLYLFSILYTLWFFGCHFFLQCLLYTLYSLVYHFMVSGCLSPLSLEMLFHTVLWSSLYLSAFRSLFPQAFYDYLGCLESRLGKEFSKLL